MKLWRMLATIVLVALPVGAVQAHNTGVEHIENYDVLVHGHKNNSLDVNETITYDFSPNERHGIYRIIPTKYDGQDGKKYYLTFKLHSVTMDGSEIHVSDTPGTDKETLKIGDPNTTITGLHTYKISYSLSPVVVQAGDKGLLTFDAVGTGWEVPIERATARFVFDDNAQLSEVHCFSGVQGSATENCQTLLSQPPVYTINEIGVGQGMTIAGYLPAGYVDHYLTPSSVPPLSHIDWAAVILATLFGLIIWIVIAVLVLRWTRARRLRKHQTVIAEYEAPDGLTPGEIGLLQDDASDMKEITATLVDLAVRGYIRIIQISPKSTFKSAQYELQYLKPLDGVQDYELTLMQAIFGTTPVGGSIKVSDINIVCTSKAIDVVKSALKDRLTQKGYYIDSKTQRGILSKLTRGGTLSGQGAGEWAKVEGFKLYLGVVEKDRLKFTDAPERTPERFSKLLPFAIALGVENQWAQQFKDIDVSQQMGWYSSNSYATWTALSLTNDLSNSFSSAVSSNMVSTSSSSGSFSGGGFSGGGGGSW